MHTGWMVLRSNAPAVARLRQSCPALLTTLEPHAQELEQRRLRWEPSLAKRGVISMDGRTLANDAPSFSAWATGNRLPTAGRCSFIVNVVRRAGDAAKQPACVPRAHSDPLPRRRFAALMGRSGTRLPWLQREARSSASKRSAADIFVGVAEESGRCVWALHLLSGKLVRYVSGSAHDSPSLGYDAHSEAHGSTLGGIDTRRLGGCLWGCAARRLATRRSQCAAHEEHDGAGGQPVWQGGRFENRGHHRPCKANAGLPHQRWRGAPRPQWAATRRRAAPIHRAHPARVCDDVEHAGGSWLMDWLSGDGGIGEYRVFMQPTFFS
jgi:hypothetical protein